MVVYMIRPDFREIKHSDLYHYGVSVKDGSPGRGSGRYPLGSGDRPYQDLSDREKKKIGKKYDRYAEKAKKSIDYNRSYIDAYNKVADDMNNGGIEKFNKDQKEKYGDDFAKREGYNKDYEDLFNESFNREYSRRVTESLVNNKYYKKADDIASKYSMYDWYDLAKDNRDAINELYELAGKIDRR